MSPPDGGGSRTARDASANVVPINRALLNAIPHLVWQSWDEGNWFESSPQWDAFTGQHEEDTHGQGWREVIHPDDQVATDEAWHAAAAAGALTIDHRIRRHDGDYRWFQTRALPVATPTFGDEPRQWIGTSTDVDDLHRAEERIRVLAYQDVLTGVGNRLMLLDALERMTRSDMSQPQSPVSRRSVARESRVQGCAPQGWGPSAPLNVLYMDIDGFKLVNDQFGHRGGDQVLQAVARRLRRWVRETDIVTRAGGDEFVLVQPGGTAKGALRLADRIRRKLSDPFVVERKRASLSVSIGIATFPKDGRTPEELLRRADLALYGAKAGGRNRSTLFEPAMETERQERQTLERDLARAIERDALDVAYQPVFDAATGLLHGYEALARWTREGHGAVPTTSFIPIAEESGLVVSLGIRILTRACRDAARGVLGTGPVSVNLSPAQFRGGTLSTLVADTLRACGLPADRLELEVTERTLLDGDEAVDRTLREIKALGVRIALDDFGTGYSNLGYLCRFPFDRLKIDRSFVRRLETDAESRAVVGGIISLAHTLRLRVTAEGVETEGQKAALRDLGCDQLQGFLLGRPELLVSAAA